MQTRTLKMLEHMKNSFDQQQQAKKKQSGALGTQAMQSAVHQATQVPKDARSQALPTQPQMASAIGGQVAAQQGATQVSDANKLRTTTQQMANVNLDAQQQQAQQALEQRQTQEDTSLFNASQRLDFMDENNKQEIIDGRLKIAQDAAQNKFLNERSLMDFQVLRGATDEQWKTYSQDIQLGYERSATMMEQATKRILQEIDLNSRITNQQLDHASKTRVMEYRRQAAAAAAKKRRKGMMVGALITGAVTIGAIATGGFGIPALVGLKGAAAGTAVAAIGSAAGQTASTIGTQKYNR